MSNYVGYDDFLSNGRSAAWNRDRELVAQLDRQNQGLLIHDTELEKENILQNMLSQLLNDNMKVGFSKYINELRIKEAKHLISNWRKSSEA